MNRFNLLVTYCSVPVSNFRYLGLQMVYSSGGGGGGGGGGASGEALVCRVAAVVPGTTEAAARQALHVASGDYQGAVRFLKVEKLYRSGHKKLSLVLS